MMDDKKRRHEETDGQNEEEEEEAEEEEVGPRRKRQAVSKDSELKSEEHVIRGPSTSNSKGRSNKEQEVEAPKSRYSQENKTYVNKDHGGFYTSQRGESGRRASDNYRIKFLVNKDRAGLIIGKQGATIKKIRDLFGANVKVGVPYGPVDRIVVIYSPEEENVRRAFEELLVLLEGKNFVDYDPEKVAALKEEILNQQLNVRFLVPNQKVGGLIGTKGATINKLKERSGADLKVQHIETMPPDAMERILLMNGQLQNILSAQKLVQAHLDTLADINPGHMRGKYGSIPYGPPPPHYDYYEPPYHEYVPAPRPSRAPAPPQQYEAVDYGERAYIPAPLQPSTGETIPSHPGYYKPRGRGPIGGGYNPRTPSYTRGHSKSASNPRPPINPRGPPGIRPPMNPPGRSFRGYQEYDSHMYQGYHQPGELEESEKVSVPNDRVGLIIGKHGATIRDIQARSGCSVEIHEPDPHSHVRIITLFGTEDSRGQAKYMIRTLL